jgi:flagellar protein FlaF
VYANISNTGTEIISDFKHMDVLVYDNEDGVYEICTYDQDLDTRGYWKITDYYGEFIHPNELDPGEVYQIQITTVAEVPKWFQITTANGVSASGFKK